MVRLSFTCTSALFSTGVVSDSIYFILFSLSPFCFPDQKLRSTQPWKRKGLLQGSNSIYCELNLPYFYPQVCFCATFMEGFVISERYIAFRQNDKLESIFKLDWHDRLENNEHLTRRPKILDWHKKETPCGA